jgi:hypothetical protein
MMSESRRTEFSFIGGTAYQPGWAQPSRGGPDRK